MISEEVTEENIKKLIEKIPQDSTALERVILANSGTVQTLLSVLFGVPIKVEVISQIEKENYFVRWSKLVADFSPEIKFTVCLAESVISKDIIYKGFITGIRERTIGIGQLISALKIQTERKLLGFYNDSISFSRTYSIESINNNEIDKNQLYIIITEVFPKDVYKRLDKS